MVAGAACCGSTIVAAGFGGSDGDEVPAAGEYLLPDHVEMVAR